MVDQPIVNRKLDELYKKHSAGGSTPRRIILSNIAREIRFSRIEIESMLNQMQTLVEEKKRVKKTKKNNSVEYAPANRDAFLNDLSTAD